MITTQMIGALITSVMVVMVWSWLYRHNIFFSFAEHTIVGIAAGYAMAVGIGNLQKLAYEPIVKGTDYSLLFPIVFGVLLFSRFSRVGSWLASYPLALIIGTGTGVAMRVIIDAQVVRQIIATIPLLAKPVGLDLFNGVIIVVTLVTTVVFFLYSAEHKGLVGRAARIGKFAVFVVLGNLYGSAISTRIGHVAGQMVVLLIESAPVSFGIVAIAVAAILVDILRRRSKQ